MGVSTKIQSPARGCYDHSEVLEGVGAAAQVSAHACGLHASASAHQIQATLTQVSASTRSHCWTAGACAWLSDTTHVCAEDVGDSQDSGACAQDDCAATLPETQV
uniref:Uncharacterized protein n=1 Tax=Cacopsylla melanoneura TaxID=428564 RepID=A0A8D8V4M6_9HEMI